MNYYIVSFLCLAMTVSNQISAETSPNWENPAVFRVNKEKAHSTLIPYKSARKAVKDDMTASRYYKSLNGKWYFKWSKDPQSRPEGFYHNDYDTSGWDKINVPSNWQL